MIKVCTGPMFSGKSEVLITNYRKIWNKDNVLCFKSSLDTRDFGFIKPRNSDGIACININSFEDIILYINEKTKTIFIDEVEFLEGNAMIILDLSLERDIDFYIAGLSLTAEQKPFGVMPYLLSIADEIKICEAVCFDCNKKATFTFYEGEKDMDILVGSSGYLPLCAKCLIKRKKQKFSHEKDRSLELKYPKG